MSRLSFLWQYIFRPRAVGAVLPSSKYLADKMVEGIDFAGARCIVEFGAGTGVFTEKILQMRLAGATVIVFEMNKAFCRELSEKFAAENNVYILNESAEGIGEHIKRHGFEFADVIISGLPFASLPAEVSERILKEARQWLRPCGCFVTFQYTLLKKGFIEQFFDSVEITREVRNVPPAYVLRCR